MDFYKKLVSSLILFPPLNSFPPFRSKEKLVSAETIQGNTVFHLFATIEILNVSGSWLVEFYFENYDLYLMSNEAKKS